MIPSLWIILTVQRADPDGSLIMDYSACHLDASMYIKSLFGNLRVIIAILWILNFLISLVHPI